jgi:hypothetical protein
MSARPSDTEANNAEAHLECALEEIERGVIVQCCGSGGHESGGFPGLIVS